MSRLRTRIIVGFGSKSYKLANLLFGFPEPNVFIDFPYVKATEPDVFLAKRDEISKLTVDLPYYRDSTYFFSPKAPKMSYHFSGISHIKLKTYMADQIPKLEVNTQIPLDDGLFIATKIFEITFLNLEQYPEYSVNRDKGTDNDKNLILNFENLQLQNLRLTGRIAAFPEEMSWFNESAPNHPIEGGVDASDGVFKKSVFFNFSPTELSRLKRICLTLLVEPNIDFFTDTNISMCATTGYTQNALSEFNSRLLLLGPIDQTKINLV